MSNGYNAKNYFAHGGSELVIGGKLTFLPGAEVEGADAPAAELVLYSGSGRRGGETEWIRI